MIKDDKSDLFSKVFVPDISKVADLLNKFKLESLGLGSDESKSNKEEEQYLGLKGYLGKYFFTV